MSQLLVENRTSSLEPCFVVSRLRLNRYGSETLPAEKTCDELIVQSPEAIKKAEELEHQMMFSLLGLLFDGSSRESGLSFIQSSYYQQYQCNLFNSLFQGATLGFFMNRCNMVVCPCKLSLVPADSIDRFIEEAQMKSQGEIEAAICAGITRFEQEYMGRGPKDIHTYLIGDFLVVRLQGVLTEAEKQLVKSQPAEKGRDLLKQVRTQLVEMARPLMTAMVQDVTGTKVVSLHHDISTTTGEEVILFTLAESPTMRDLKKK